MAPGRARDEEKERQWRRWIGEWQVSGLSGDPAAVVAVLGGGHAELPPAVRIWLALAPADLRKGFDALAELVRQHLRDDPLSGHVFVFRNRRGDRIKLLYWDTDLAPCGR
jgi:hypothetical protein